MNSEKRTFRGGAPASEDIGWKFPIWVILATLGVILLLYLGAYYLKHMGG